MTEKILAGLLGAFVAGAQGGCALDDADKCGPHMEFSDSQVCTCVENAVEVTGGCEPCAPGDVVDEMNQACVCPAGQTRDGGGTCREVAGLGDPCNGDDLTCDDPLFNRCAVAVDATTGYCTSSCVDDSGCEAAYTCAVWEDEPYCRTFTGVGQACESSDDCAGNDAGFCETLQSHTCQIATCTVGIDECPRDNICCDLSSYGLGTLCSSPEDCPT